MVELEKVTPEMIVHMPSVVSTENNKKVFEKIVKAAKVTYPMPFPPERSESFLSDKHIFDFIAIMYVKIFGNKFANFYQDVFVKQTIAAIDDPVKRLWFEARNYALYGRLEKAERLYHRILNDFPENTYRRRAIIFLSQLLIKQQRYVQAVTLLQQFLSEYPNDSCRNDCFYYMGLCYEKLSDIPNAITYYKHVQDAKLYSEARLHLSSLIQEF